MLLVEFSIAENRIVQPLGRSDKTVPKLPQQVSIK